MWWLKKKAVEEKELGSSREDNYYKQKL